MLSLWNLSERKYHWGWGLTYSNSWDALMISSCCVELFADGGGEATVETWEYLRRYCHESTSDDGAQIIIAAVGTDKK